MAFAPDLFDGADEDEREGGVFSEINVTPFVDVMLVLLVVFMVAAPLMVQGVPIDLPKSGGTSLGHPAKPLIVSLSRDGSLFLRDDKVAPSELPAHLQAIRANEGDVLIYVRADRGIAYGDVMDLIARLGGGGFTHVSLLSQPTTAKTNP